MKIEKNIPITPKYSSVAREMETEDSVLCQTKREAHSLRGALYRTGHKAVTRKLPEGTWRVWKVSVASFSPKKY